MPEGITAAEIQEGRHVRKSSPLAIVPSWLISLCLHGSLLYFFATHLPASWGPGSTNGQPSGEFREVGIYVKGAGEEGGAAGAPDGANIAQDQPAANEPEQPAMKQAEINPLDIPRASDSLVSDRPPVKLATPMEANPALGPGAGPDASPPSAVREAIANQRKLGAEVGNRSGYCLGNGAGWRRRNGARFGAAPFFGIGDRGTRFVYVIDCSGSMAHNSAIRVAKDELMSSLESLERTQQFQIIFYDTEPHPMLLKGESGKDLYWATTVNRNAARRFIADMKPLQGTDHMPALRLALRLKPEVIFFLTDADLPKLSAADFAEIQRLNGNGTRIHCIRFGQGADLEPTNFMTQLAAQNGGRYRYRDVASFK